MTYFWTIGHSVEQFDLDFIRSAILILSLILNQWHEPSYDLFASSWESHIQNSIPIFSVLCLYYLNSWCVGSCKHRENFQFHHHRIRIFLTLLFSFSKISLSLWQKLEPKPNTTVEFEIVRYQFMKVNGSGATKINVVGKYFLTYKCKDVSIPL